MKKIQLICLLIFCLSSAQVFAQTKAKPQKTTKTTTSKKPAKAISVYVCTDNKDKFFHKYSSCSKLNKCSNQIINVKSAAELKKYKRKSCLHCFNM